MRAILLFACYCAAVQAQNKVNDWSGDSVAPGSATPEECAGDVFPQKLDHVFAGFEVEYRNTYKIVRNKIAGQLDTPQTYVLWQRGCTKPTEADVGETVHNFFEVPLTSVWSTSSTHVGKLDFIGERRALRVMSGIYSSDACIHRQNLDGYTLNTGGLKWNTTDEQWCEWSFGATECGARPADINALGLDAVLSSDFAGNHLFGDPFEIRMSDIRETTFLRIAEWNEYLAAFFNREEEIRDFDQGKRALWLCNADGAATVPDAEKKTVLWLSYQSWNTPPWRVTTCNSMEPQHRFCELLQAAGANVIVEDVSGLLSLSSDYKEENGAVGLISAEHLVQWAKDVDVIITDATRCPWGADEAACNEYFDNFFGELAGIAAVDNNQIWDLGRLQDPSGGTGFFEAASLEPDVLLEDVISVIYPHLTEGHELTFLRNMKTEGVGNIVLCSDSPDAAGCLLTTEEIAAKCVPDEPYQLLEDGIMPCCGSGKLGEVTRDGVICTDIDECATDEDNCDEEAACSNTDGSFTCACNEGLKAWGGGSSCDEDECAAETHNCAGGATCTDTDGSFTCACNWGFTGDGLTCTAVVAECTGGGTACQAEVSFSSTLGMSKSEFENNKEDDYIAAVADAAGVETTDVTVDSVTETTGRRLLSTSIVVETTVKTTMANAQTVMDSIEEDLEQEMQDAQVELVSFSNVGVDPGAVIEPPTETPTETPSHSSALSVPVFALAVAAAFALSCGHLL